MSGFAARVRADLRVDDDALQAATQLCDGQLAGLMMQWNQQQ
eukprot:gene78-33295_t